VKKIGLKPIIPVLFGALLALTVSWPATASTDIPAGPEESPEETVKQLEEVLLENMRAGERMNYRERLDTLLPVMDRVLAIEAMARFLFSDTWQSIDDSQRDAFRDLFLELSASSYAHSFDQYNGQSFQAVSAQVQSPKRALVRRQLVTGKGRQVQFDYLLTPAGGHWKIVVVMTDGVSQLSIKRSQYRRLIDQSGFDAVLESMQEVIEKRAADA